METGNTMKACLKVLVEEATEQIQQNFEELSPTVENILSRSSKRIQAWNSWIIHHNLTQNCLNNKQRQFCARGKCNTNFPQRQLWQRDGRVQQIDLASLSWELGEVLMKPPVLEDTQINNYL